MSRETIERARRVADEIEDRVGMQKLLIVRLRNRGANAMRAAQLLDEMKDDLHVAREWLAREEAAGRISLWLQHPPTEAIH
jgi:hypothetical protein